MHNGGNEFLLTTSMRYSTLPCISFMVQIRQAAVALKLHARQHLLEWTMVKHVTSMKAPKRNNCFVSNQLRQSGQACRCNTSLSALGTSVTCYRSLPVHVKEKRVYRIYILVRIMPYTLYKVEQLLSDINSSTAQDYFLMTNVGGMHTGSLRLTDYLLRLRFYFATFHVLKYGHAYTQL